ncbi:MAG: ABC transporter permease [Proteobacteria bacterium]|nr:ABC transporter permease [Pseudomonadota bacterium]
MRNMTRQVLPFASLILLVGALAVAAPERFLTLDNLLNVLRRSSVNAILAVGMTWIIICAGIDLSVGSALALASMVGAWTLQQFGGAFTGTAVGILVGAVCGFANGVLVTRLRLPPFIVTLGTMSTFRGLAYVMNDGQPYNVPGYTRLGAGNLLGIPVSIAIAAGCILLGGWALARTRLGRSVYAIGSNRSASFHAGININGSLTLVYTLAGLYTGIAAMIATSRTVSAQPTAGISVELDIIAAVVIGGASLAGGRGSIAGAMVGTLLIGFLRNGCTLLGISTNVQLIVIGIIIIAAVAIDQAARGAVVVNRPPLP